MIELKTKYDTVKIFTDNVEQEALGQITQMANSPLGKDAHIRIMPDCHAGKGCTIGTTLKITDKVCPNLVGVDIGCGVTYAETSIGFKKHFADIDSIIRTKIPYGMNVGTTKRKTTMLQTLKCWDKLKNETQELAYHSLGTLGGGNHFIECYDNKGIAVHSGSRNIGYRVAEYYQTLAEKSLNQYYVNQRKELLKDVEPKKREQFLKNNKISYNKELAYLTGQNMQDYLHDIKILQDFAMANRYLILHTIIDELGGTIRFSINSTHNYIDTTSMILRKGAICAGKDELLVIPLNMRDGILLCRGKGNKDWNYSAPHGAGRLYSRSQAKKEISLDEYKKSMQGIYSTCVNENTIDESPFAYKDYKEIIKFVKPTVTILERLKPIYNFKAD